MSSKVSKNGLSSPRMIFTKPSLGLAAVFITLFSQLSNKSYAGSSFDLLYSLQSILNTSPLSAAFTFIAVVLCLRLLNDRIAHTGGLSCRTLVFSSVCSAILSLFRLLGESVELSGSLNYITENRIHLLRAVIAFGGCFFVLLFLLLLFDTVSRTPRLSAAVSGRSRILPGWYDLSIEKRPFTTAFFTLFISYLPTAVLSYPAHFMGDTWWQITKGFGLSPMTNHHPYAHTMLLNLCLRAGLIFSSWNLGAFLYVLVQTLLFSCVAAYAFKYVMAVSGKKTALLFFLWFIVHPRIRNYMPLITKDVIYAVFLLLYLVSLHSLYIKEKLSPAFFISVIGVFLFRNEGFFILLFSQLILILVSRRVRILSGCVIAVTLLFSLFWNMVLLPLCSVAPGSKGEMLSVPFQQTARYALTSADDITQEERNTIDRVLEFDKLTELYRPDIADPVKQLYRSEASSSDLLNYLKVYFHQFLKHPGIYLEALLANKYLYLFPSSQLTSFDYSYHYSTLKMENISNIQALHARFCRPEALQRIARRAEQIRESIFHLPVLNLSLSSAFYIWCAIALFFHYANRKDTAGFVLSFSLLIQVLVIFAGPTNGNYFRYIYPIAFCLPFVAAIGFPSAHS